MKRVLFISILVCANLLTVRANDPFITHTFPASSLREVEAITSGGSITVNGDAVSEAVVEVYVSRDKWSDEKIKETLDENYTIDIKVENGKLYAVAKPKIVNLNWNRQGVNISLKIIIPRQTNSNLRTSGGSIHISNLSGSQDFTTSGGSLTVENVSGDIVGKTSGGSITITNSNDNIDLRTSGGSITTKFCDGKIKLRTSGGSIHLSDLNGDIDVSTSGGSVTAKNIAGVLKTGTSGGSVKLDGISGSVEVKTSGGSINVAMESVSEYVKLSNSGNISLTLPAGKGYDMKVNAGKVETSGLKYFRGYKEETSGLKYFFHGNMANNSMEGTVGNGGPEIEIRTSQRVSISFQ